MTGNTDWAWSPEPEDHLGVVGRIQVDWWTTGSPGGLKEQWRSRTSWAGWVKLLVKTETWEVPWVASTRAGPITAGAVHGSNLLLRFYRKLKYIEMFFPPSDVRRQTFVCVGLESLWCTVAYTQWIMLRERGFRFHMVRQVHFSA